MSVERNINLIFIKYLLYLNYPKTSFVIGKRSEKKSENIVTN